MNKNVTFFEKAYVGLQNIRTSYGEGNDFNIGFLAEYGEDSAAKKRMGTVDRWRDKNIDVIITDNIPLDNFEIIGFSSRYMTDNKVARILDPRGFILEVYMDNFDRIISENIIDHGIIKSKMIWGRSDGKNVLMREDSKEYKDYLDKKSRGVVKSGESYNELDVIISKGDKYVYLGRRFILTENYIPSLRGFYGALHFKIKATDVNNIDKFPVPDTIVNNIYNYKPDRYLYGNYNEAYEKYARYSCEISGKYNYSRNNRNEQSFISLLKESPTVNLSIGELSGKPDYHCYQIVSKQNDKYIVTNPDRIEIMRSKIKADSILDEYVENIIDFDDNAIYENQNFGLMTYSDSFINEPYNSTSYRKHDFYNNRNHVAIHGLVGGHRKFSVYKDKKSYMAAYNKVIEDFKNGVALYYLPYNDQEYYIDYIDSFKESLEIGKVYEGVKNIY